VVGGSTVGLGDVDVLLAEGLAHRRQNARLVVGGDAELHGPIDLGLGVPADLDAAFRIGVEGFDALAPVDGHAATARDEADDVVTRQRVTALGVAHQHVVDAGHRDAAAFAPAHAVDD